jgi:hypothetical protein
MKDFATIPRTDGSFPNVEVVPDSSPHLHDGTPVHYQWGNEVWGAFQAILNGASLTPSVTTSETCGATAGDVTGSQIVEALQLMLSVPGEIIGFPGDTIPTGARLLKCAGSLATRTHSITGKYSRLLNVWCGAGANLTAPSFFRTSDAGGTARNPAGNYIVIPDLRGVFLRGRDAAAGIDPEGATREFGDKQTESIKQHGHNEILNIGGVEYTAHDFHVGTEVTEYYAFEAAGTGHLHTGSTGTGIGSGTSNETRPTNGIVTWCIRY